MSNRRKDVISVRGSGKIARSPDRVVRCALGENFAAWAHARFGFFVKNFLTQNEK
jgi:hypothetical protein